MKKIVEKIWGAMNEDPQCVRWISDKKELYRKGGVEEELDPEGWVEDWLKYLISRDEFESWMNERKEGFGEFDILIMRSEWYCSGQKMLEAHVYDGGLPW